MNVIEFSNVSKQYKKGLFEKTVHAVVNCSFNVEQGKVTGFIGPNGAGKTTSIKMMLGLAKPTSGQIRVWGKDPVNPVCRKDTAYISEQPYFYGHLTVAETLLFAAQLGCHKLSDPQKSIEASLKQVGLEGHSKRKIKDLSKGMQQRCAMAQAILLNPKILVLDEPLSGLDPPGRRLFRSILRNLAEQGVTIFFSTHIVDDVELLCQNVIVLSNGKTEYQGPVDSLLQKGIKGVDITTQALPQDLKDEMLKAGYEITLIEDNKTNIFVSNMTDVKECQRRLFSSGFFCESIATRTNSQEDILYSIK